MATNPRSKLELLNDYVVIDIETTGFYVGLDEIIEIGAIKVSNGIIDQAFNTLISDASSIPAEITGLTGISQTMLKDGMPIKQAMKQFLSFCGDSVVVGHNVGFDVRFLTEEARSCGQKFENDYVCTLRLARKIYPTLINHQLITLAEHLELPTKGFHRTVYDCVTVAQLYEQLKDDVNKSGRSLIDLFKRKPQKSFDLSTITANQDYDENNPFNGLNVVFTGTLEHHSRIEGAQLLANLGASIQNGVNKKTNLVIIGHYLPHQKIETSNKVKRAMQLVESGFPIQVINSDTFYEWLEDYSGA